jgi:hypothetical protein
MAKGPSYRLYPGPSGKQVPIGKKMSYCEEHKKLNDDIKGIKQGIDKIRANHLRQLNYKLNVFLWVVSVAFATIAILTSMIAQGIAR